MRGSAYNAAMKVHAADTIIEVGGIKIGPSLTKEQAEKLYGLGQEAVVFVLAIVPIRYLLTLFMGYKLRSIGEGMRYIHDRLTSLITEIIDGHSIAQMYSLENRQKRRYRLLLKEKLKTGFRLWRTRAFWGNAGQAISTIWGALILLGGWFLLFSGALKLGEAVALAWYISVISRPFQHLENLYTSLMTLSVSSDRLDEILSKKTNYFMYKRTQLCRPQKIQLKKISFAYPGQPYCLENINIDICAGENTVLIGPCGSGKSTLLKLLAGLVDNYDGVMLVDNANVKDIALQAYRRHISFVQQTHFFFHDTLRHNLSPENRSISEKKLTRYIDSLGLDGIFHSTQVLLDKTIGTNGLKLSVGGLQKLSVLRGVIKEPSLLLLDEISSAIDIEAEKKLFRGIIQYKNSDCSVVLATHQVAIATESWVDRLIVLIDGKIIEDGSPKELFEQHGYYYKWLNMCNETESRTTFK